MSCPPPRPPGRAAVAFVCVTILLDILAVGLMVPVLPRLIVEFEGGDVERAAVISGLFGLAWAAMQFLASPVLGALSDRFGRRPVLLLSSLGLGLDYVLMALAPNLAWLLVGRLVSGITSASAPTAIAYIADVTPPEQRAAKFGLLGAAFGLGFIAGPALGGLLAGIDPRLPFWAAAALSLANAAYGLLILPESLPPERRARFTWAGASPFGALALLRSSPALLGLAGATALIFLAQESLPSLYVLYVMQRYGWDEAAVGLSLAAVGAGSMVVSAALIGPAVARLGERWAMAAGLVFGVAGFALFALAPTGRLILAAIPLLSLWALTGPALQALMSRRVGAEEQGRLQGALSGLHGITGMIGPVLFTQSFAIGIAPAAGLDLPGLPYGLASALLAISLVMAWRITRAEGSQPDAEPALPPAE
ncbi:TCR/Tet family MFS transporter [Inquilinus limosus]|uniref:Tetracycline resistance MFS efflux pump n=1 Tax=Inquilinus limosus TaxID=171674 RepID=A0A211ZP03_9PROT|nr:TCR/Tet family MFS transporter [Inquilinus limosus]OWJ67005.1 tetracycline resistance MFS efflux pump [Inquilinus limosus]